MTDAADAVDTAHVTAAPTLTSVISSESEVAVMDEEEEWWVGQGKKNDAGPTSWRICECPYNRGLERKFGSPPRIGVHLRAPLGMGLLAHYPNNKIGSWLRVSTGDALSVSLLQFMCSTTITNRHYSNETLFTIVVGIS
jgi:hypothetical protein